MGTIHTRVKQLDKLTPAEALAAAEADFAAAAERVKACDFSEIFHAQSDRRVADRVWAHCYRRFHNLPDAPKWLEV